MFQLYNMVMIMIQYEDLSRIVQFCQTRLQSYGLQMTFQPSSKYFLHFWFYLMTRLLVGQVDSTVLPVSFLDQTPLDSRFCPLESSRVNWTRLKGNFHGDGKRKILLQSLAKRGNLYGEVRIGEQGKRKKIEREKGRKECIWDLNAISRT